MQQRMQGEQQASDRSGRKSEAQIGAESGPASMNGPPSMNSSGGPSWWERFSPTAAAAKAKTADAVFSVPPSREPASARTNGNASIASIGGVSTNPDAANSSWWTRFSPRAAETGAETGGGWWGFSPRYANHPNALIGGQGMPNNPFASTGDASALAAAAAAQAAAQAAAGDAGAGWHS